MKISDLFRSFDAVMSKQYIFRQQLKFFTTCSMEFNDKWTKNQIQNMKEGGMSIDSDKISPRHFDIQCLETME